MMRKIEEYMASCKTTEYKLNFNKGTIEFSPFLPDGVGCVTWRIEKIVYPPQKVRNLSIVAIGSTYVVFDTSEELVPNFSNFGTINKESSCRYTLYIDTRYNMDDIVNYMKSFE